MSMKHAVPEVSSSRREFTIKAVMALLSGYVITVSEACGSSNTSPTPPPATPVSDISGTVSANHGHIATVTGVQITAGNQVTLDITGTATHTHSLTLSAANLASLKSRQAITVTSTNNNNHQHDVTFTPA
jgi:hypothetical protein